MHLSRIVVVPLALALSGGLAGCAFLTPLTGGGGGATPPPTPTSASGADAASAFTETICTFNDAAFAFDETWSDLEAPLRDVQEAASLSRIEAGVAREQLEAVSWPADIADDVVVIEEYLQQRIEKLDAVISAESVEELDEIDFTTPEPVNTAAAEVEAFLELGADYCPATEDPADPADPADELASSTWTGTDSDGDETEVLLGADGSATVTVADVVYEGTWDLAVGVLSIDVSGSETALAFSGFYEAGASTMTLSGTATNGHTWTVELQRG